MNLDGNRLMQLPNLACFGEGDSELLFHAEKLDLRDVGDLCSRHRELRRVEEKVHSVIVAPWLLLINVSYQYSVLTEANSYGCLVTPWLPANGLDCQQPSVVITVRKVQAESASVQMHLLPGKQTFLNCGRRVG